MSEPVYMCVHVPEFAAQAMLRLRPQTPGAAVVLAGEPPLDQVCSLNSAAARLGIVRGMTRAELESFTDVSVLRRSVPEERAARAALIEAAGAFTPRVEVHAGAAAAFVMVLDMTGTERLFGAPDACAQRVSTALKALRFHVQLAVCGNFHASVCLAAVARVRAEIIAGRSPMERLRSLPLATLNLTSAQAEAFALWGMSTLGELAALPEAELISRMGQDGKRLRLLARGEHPHLMVPEEAVFALAEFIAFDEPVELLDSLLFVLGPMLDQLIERAGQRSLALASLTVVLGLDGGGTHERTLKPAVPVMHRELLLRLVHLDLAAHPPSAGILSVRVSAEPGDQSRVQLGIFAPPLPEPLRLEVTLARLAAIVGEGRVGRPELKDTHRADSFVMLPFRVSGFAKRPDSMTKRTASALRRCRPSVRLTVEHKARRPAAFTFNGKRFCVEQAYGPWRRSGEWWTAEVWSEEEWDLCAVAQNETLLCLLAHDLLRDRWRMEALYD